MYDSISIIGMDKNVGKTTTLNYLISILGHSYKLGITSIGRDGEKIDEVTRTHKPVIYVPKGTLIATAKEFLYNSDITLEIIEKTQINTSIGPVIIVKALSDGNIVLAGPSISFQMQYIKNRMIELGCDKILIDGAVDRKSFASPIISQSVIIATGASVSHDMQDVISKTKGIIDIFSIPALEENEILTLIKKIPKDIRLSFITSDGFIKNFKLKTSLSAAKPIAHFIENNLVKYVVIKGIVVNEMIQHIMSTTNNYNNVTFVFEDATKIHIDSDILFCFLEKGAHVRVIQPINLIAITANPTSPFGYEFEEKIFIEELRKEINIPVLNVMGCE